MEPCEAVRCFRDGNNVDYVGDKLRSFIRSPHIPVVLLLAVRRVSPTAARILEYGRYNVNSKRYWNKRYEAANYEDERYRVLRHEIMKLIPAQARVLDAGCGNGSFIELLRERGSVFAWDLISQT